MTSTVISYIISIIIIAAISTTTAAATTTNTYDWSAVEFLAHLSMKSRHLLEMCSFSK